MSIFTKRISAPNQMATLREMEARVNVGKVLFVKDSVAVVRGLNIDAPLGTKLSFVTGGIGVLLWHRSDNISFVLILGGASAITEGTGLECKITGVLQVMDEAKGPVTKKQYELFEVPAGEALFGRVTNYVGLAVGDLEHLDSNQAASTSLSSVARKAVGMDRTRPLLNTQVPMALREQICESLLTGVKALDVMTPLGRGTSMLVISPKGSGKASLAEDTLLGQRGAGVHCVLASTTRSPDELTALSQRLASAGATAHTCVVAANPDASLGQKYAAICTAFSIAEAVRDNGGHGLVVVDDIAPLSQLWDMLAISGLGSLGKEMARQGLIKDSEGRDLPLPPPTSDSLEQEMVDYEGMLVSGAMAQRRGFFSSLFQRCAKMSKAEGGGSLTTLLLVPGRPATGVSKKVDMGKYQTLSPEQKTRILAVLEKRAGEEAGSGVPALGSTPPGELSTEVVEEFISIADGQLVLEGVRAAGGSYRANPRLSVTRIGTRALPRALDALAPQIRLGLAQAEDARRFQLQAVGDPLSQRADGRALRMAAALTQPPGQPACLEELVVTLLAVQRGHADGVQPEQMTTYLERAYAFVQASAPQALKEITATRQLTATAEKAVDEALATFNVARIS